ncbi:ankyrin repeat domain-containing protein [Hydrogenophaga sp.]|uniref:ankyrin repeat domain-containing protein n=1 Tax=Hydrogenophaga sp. TaxID=1904254 RepID=UPI00271A96D7|nr:ankyrin repeat domain-containing protein [Hydrogenophaga sp.]MDO9438772.1 ankyrin repeat domain-containing protein [Hydrogenophaga sp.]
MVSSPTTITSTTTTNTTATTTTTTVTRTDVDAPGTTTAALHSTGVMDMEATDTTHASEGSVSSSGPVGDVTARSSQPPFTGLQTPSASPLRDAVGTVLPAHRETAQAMVTAICANDSSKVRAILKRSSLLNEYVQTDTTPLQLASSVGAHKVVAYLLKDPNIEINKAGRHGWAPLHLAARVGEVRTIALLLKMPGIRLNITLPSGATPYLVALEYGHLKLAQLLLNKGVNTDMAMKNGFRPLHVACQRGSLATVRWLLKQPSNLRRDGKPQTLASVLNQATLDGWTPLLLAAQSGKKDLFEFLLMHPLVKPDLVNMDGNTPLHLAIQGGYVAMVELLVKTGRGDITLINGDGATPFFLAIRHRPKVLPELLLPLLLNIKADIHQPTRAGLRPLHAACQNGDIETVQWLLDQPSILQGKHRYKGKAFRMDTVLNELTHEGKSLLRLAVDTGKESLVALLLERGARPNLADDFHNTPLHMAVKAGHRSIAYLLLQHPKIEVNCSNLKGGMPITEAIEQDDMLMEELLMAAGADVNFADKNGTTALHQACGRHNLLRVQRLLERPAILLLDGKPGTVAQVLNQIDNDGDTPLLYAIDEGDDAEAVVKFLLKQPGIDPDLANKVGEAPLHLACRLGVLGIVRLLVNAGANIERPDAEGATPLHLASEEGAFEVVKWLLDRLAMPMANGQRRDMSKVLNNPNGDGDAPLHLATEQEHKEVVRALLGHPAVDPNLMTTAGQTALHKAAQDGLLDTVIQLVRHEKIALDATAASTGTPFHAAISTSNLDIAEVLLELGANIHSVDAKGFTPLHTACHHGDLESVQWLLKRSEIRLLNGTRRSFSAVLNQPTTAGETPLYLAIQSQNINVIRHLLSGHLNPNQLTANGKAPLHEATRRGNVAAVTALLKYPKINAFQRGPGGDTVLHFISSVEHAKPLLEAFRTAMGPDAFRKLAESRNARGEKASAIADIADADDAVMPAQLTGPASNSSAKPSPNA